MAEPSPAPSVPMQWLHALYGTAETGWLSLFTIDSVSASQRVDWAPVTDLPSMAATIETRAPDCDVWLGVGTRRERLTGGRRGGIADIAGLPALWLDVDIEGPNHKGGHPLPPDVPAALELLADFPIPPSVIVHTGGGLQPWWFLTKLADPTDVPLADWGHTWDQLAAKRGWHLDNVYDAARILRVPGTYNRKNEPAAVHIIDGDLTRRYGIDDLEQHLTPAPPPPSTTMGDRLPYIGPKRPGDAFNARHSGHEMVQLLGCHSPKNKADGSTDYTRPGKNTGTSVTVYPDDHTTFWSETCAAMWPGLEVRRPYDPFGLYAVTQHRGDWIAATSALAATGYGEQRQPDDLSWAVIVPPTVLELPAEAGDEEHQEPDHGWLPADLAAITAAGYEQPRPTLLRRDDGACMFYAGRMNGLFGESGSGKSWLALLAAAQEIQAGHHVLYVDLEDHAASVCGRMIALGVTVDQLVELFFYISPNIPWTDAAAAWTGHRIQQHDTTLAVIDSTGEAMALDGAKPNDDDATATWFRKLPRFLARLGVTVLLIDHQPKNEEGGRHTEIGSQRKRAAIDGASYHVEAPVSPARGVEGHLKLTCVKDRNGMWQKGALVADIDVKSNPEGTDVRIAVKRHEKVTRPTFLMQKISEYLEALGAQGSNQRGIEANVKGKGTGIRKAIEVLINEGYVNQDVRGGNRGFLYTSIQPFRDDDMDMFVVDNPDGESDETATASPRPYRVPTASPTEGTHSSYRVPRVPPPIRKGAERDAVAEKSKDAETPQSPPVDNPPASNQGDQPWTLI